MYDGDRLLCEILQANSNPKELWFLYDGSGQLVGLQYQNQTYIFVKNIQGDVTQLRQGNTVVANYTYDAWGKLLSVTDANGAAITNASHIANLNPIRYRSYFVGKVKYISPCL